MDVLSLVETTIVLTAYIIISVPVLRAFNLQKHAKVTILTLMLCEVLLFIAYTLKIVTDFGN